METPHVDNVRLLLLSTTPDFKWESGDDPLQLMGIYLAEQLATLPALSSAPETFKPEETALPIALSGRSPAIQQVMHCIDCFSKSLAFVMGLYNAICDSGASIPVQRREELWVKYLKILVGLSGRLEWPDQSHDKIHPGHTQKNILMEIQRLISMDDEIGRLSINADTLLNSRNYMASQATATVYLTKILTDCLPEAQSDEDNTSRILEMVYPDKTGRLVIAEALPILITAAKNLISILKAFMHSNKGAFDSALEGLSVEGAI